MSEDKSYYYTSWTHFLKKDGNYTPSSRPPSIRRKSAPPATRSAREVRHSFNTSYIELLVTSWRSRRLVQFLIGYQNLLYVVITNEFF